MCVATPSIAHSLTSATQLLHSPLHSTQHARGREEGWKVVVASQVANGGMLVWFSHWTESIRAQCSCGCALSHQWVRYNTYLLFLPLLLSVLPSQAVNTNNTDINNRRRSRHGTGSGAKVRHLPDIDISHGVVRAERVHLFDQIYHQIPSIRVTGWEGRGWLLVPS